MLTPFLTVYFEVNLVLVHITGFGKTAFFVQKMNKKHGANIYLFLCAYRNYSNRKPEVQSKSIIMNCYAQRLNLDNLVASMLSKLGHPELCKISVSTETQGRTAATAVTY